MRILPLFLTAALLALPACDGGTPDGGNGTLSATAAGASFSASVVQASFNSGVLSVGGSSVSNPPQQVTLAVPDARAGQTYTFGASAATAVWTEGTGQNDSYTANMVTGSGQITVQALSDDGARGTFSFTGRNTGGETRAITGGTFDVTF